MKLNELNEEQRADILAELIDGGTFEYMDYCKKRKDGKGYDLRSDNFGSGDMEIVSAKFLSDGLESVLNDIYNEDYKYIMQFIEEMGVEL